jgi:hypothetical protein
MHQERRYARKVFGLEVLRCDAGWRNYHFLKKTTDGGPGSCPDRRSIREL